MFFDIFPHEDIVKFINVPPEKKRKKSCKKFGI